MDSNNFVGEDPEGGGYVVYVNGEPAGVYSSQSQAEQTFNSLTGQPNAGNGINPGAPAPSARGSGAIGSGYHPGISSEYAANLQYDLGLKRLALDQAYQDLVQKRDTDSLIAYRKAETDLKNAALDFQKIQFGVGTQMDIWKQRNQIANDVASHTGRYRPPEDTPRLPDSFYQDQDAKKDWAAKIDQEIPEWQQGEWEKQWKAANGGKTPTWRDQQAAISTWYSRRPALMRYVEAYQRKYGHLPASDEFKTEFGFGPEAGTVPPDAPPPTGAGPERPRPTTPPARTTAGPTSGNGTGEGGEEMYGGYQGGGRPAWQRGIINSPDYQQARQLTEQAGAEIQAAIARGAPRGELDSIRQRWDAQIAPYGQRVSEVARQYEQGGYSNYGPEGPSSQLPPQGMRYGAEYRRQPGPGFGGGQYSLVGSHNPYQTATGEYVDPSQAAQWAVITGKDIYGNDTDARQRWLTGETGYVYDQYGRPTSTQTLAGQQQGWNQGYLTGQLLGTYGGLDTLQKIQADRDWQFRQAQMAANPENAATVAALRGQAPWQQGGDSERPQPGSYFTGGSLAMGGGRFSNNAEGGGQIKPWQQGIMQGGQGGQGATRRTLGVPGVNRMSVSTYDTMSPDQKAAFGSFAKAGGQTPQEYDYQLNRARPQNRQQFGTASWAG